MTGAQLEQWIEKTGATERTNEYANRIDYVFFTLPDGWIAIFEYWRGIYTPMIQAQNRAHALSYIAMREPVTVPMDRLC